MTDQFTLGSTSQRDAIDVIEGDHQTVEQLFARFERLRTEGDAKGKRPVVASIIRELKIHAEVEEEVLYPNIRRLLADGDALASEAVREHAEAKQALAEIERTPPEDPGFDAKVTTLINDVRHHVNEEESEMLPKLRSAVGASLLVALGDDLEAAKRAREAYAAITPPPPPTAGAPPKPAAAVAPGPSAPAARPAKKPAAAPKKKPAATRRRTAASAAKKSTARGKKSAATSKKRTATRPATKRTTTSTPRRRSSPRVLYRVKPSDRGWEVTRKGAKRASGLFDRKPDAVARGKELAKRSRLGQLVVHGQDGKIQGEFTFGEDPRRTKR
jgi:hemerythrin superfamily protein